MSNQKSNNNNIIILRYIAFSSCCDGVVRSRYRAHVPPSRHRSEQLLREASSVRDRCGGLRRRRRLLHLRAGGKLDAGSSRLEELHVRHSCHHRAGRRARNALQTAPRCVDQEHLRQQQLRRRVVDSVIVVLL